MRTLLYIGIALLYSLPSQGDINIKLRAREHFLDHHNIKFSDGSSTKYSGLSNTINIWHERPFRYSIGLSISPIIGSPKAKDSTNAPLGDKIQLQVYGVEGKYFPLKGFKGFLRGGYGYTRLKGSGTLNGVDGSSYYLGAGWEIPVWRIHIAPEYAIRKSKLQKDVEIDSTVISVGFHFYEHF